MFFITLFQNSSSAEDLLLNSAGLQKQLMLSFSALKLLKCYTFNI